MPCGKKVRPHNSIIEITPVLLHGSLYFLRFFILRQRKTESPHVCPAVSIIIVKKTVR